MGCPWLAQLRCTPSRISLCVRLPSTIFAAFRYSRIQMQTHLTFTQCVRRTLGLCDKVYAYWAYIPYKCGVRVLSAALVTLPEKERWR